MFRRFLWMHICFGAFVQIDGVFVNTFVLRVTGNQQHVMIFNIVLAIVQPAAMVLSVRLMRHFSPIRTQQWGLGLYCAIYILLIIGLDKTMDSFLIIAAILSAAAGFYYTTYILQLLCYTSEGNRDTAIGVIGMFGSTLSLLAPLLSGFLISLFSDYSGYRLLFVACAAISSLALYFSTRLAPLPFHEKKSSIKYKQILRIFTNDTGMRAAMSSSFLQGIYAGTVGVFINILLYTLVKNESLIGTQNFLRGMIGITASAVYARKVKPANRVQIMVIALLSVLGLTSLMYLHLSPMMIILYGFILSLATPFFSNPPLILYMGVLQAQPQLQDHGAEVHASREFYYAAGRVAGLVVAIVLPQTNAGAVTVLITLTGVQLLSAVYCRRMQSVLKQGA